MIKSAAQSSLLNDTRYTSMSAGIVPSNEYLIATTVLTADTPSVTFDVSSFAGVYKHLQIVYSVRTSESDTLSWGKLRFNGATSGYANHSLNGFGGNTITSTGIDSTDAIGMRSAFSAANDVANSFCPGIIDILDPYNTSKNTTIRVFSGNPGSTTRVNLNSGFWNSTASITSIQLYPFGGQNLVSGSRFSLYGVTA
jgi:hypothetical protein